MEIIPKAIVKEVCVGSIAQEAGIQKGDIIYKINNEIVHDILEYEFLIAEEELEIEVIKADGTVEFLSIVNEDYEEIGITFENPLIDKAKHCSNKCIFCFIDQLPKGLRKTLYFKDDDSRLSFLQGNYVTLTNMSDADIERIIRYRLSPINISVHTTKEKLRVEMLGNPKAKKIRSQIKKLADAKITMNCQIVLCREVNDNEELNYTLNDLTLLYPYVHSISIVPVGLSQYREGLYPLMPFNKQSAAKVIDQVEKWQSEMLNQFGTRIIFLGDEFYILADRAIPAYNHYEAFPQIENGVGLIASMQFEFDEAIKRLAQPYTPINREISIATGVIAKPFIQSLCDRLEEKYKGIKINVYAIENKFFGGQVTVAGLVTGGDLIEQLKGKVLGQELLIPITMLRSDRDIFLDDISIEDVEKELDIKVTLVENDGSDFIQKVMQMEVRNG